MYTTQLKDCQRSIADIESQTEEWPDRYGRMVATAKYFAVVADEKTKARRDLICDAPSLVSEYLKHDDSPQAIYALLTEIWSRISTKRYDDNTLPQMDDLLTEFDNFVHDYKNSPERQREAAQEAAESRADAKREEGW